MPSSVPLQAEPGIAHSRDRRHRSGRSIPLSFILWKCRQNSDLPAASRSVSHLPGQCSTKKDDPPPLYRRLL